MIFGSIPLLITGVVILTLAFIGLLISHIKLRKKLSFFMQGKNGASLEECVATSIERNTNVEKTLTAHKEALEIINTRLTGSIRGLSLVHYNAFQNAGGTQSFAAGFLDEQGNGFILSVVTNRNHVGVYAKPIRDYQSEVELTPEETQALNQAKEQQII